MKRSALAWQALAKGVGGLAVMALLLFLPAGSWGYWQAWLFLGLLFVPMTCVAIWLLVREPELLAKRLSSKEQEKAQRQVVALSALMFIVGFLLAGFDQRYGWSEMPAWVVAIAAVVMVCGYGLYAEVMRENAYLSRTVEVQENQEVISTGLYGIVRHPMYAATLVLYLAMPIVLGSWVALIPFLAYPLIIARRIRNEEQVLEEGLAGYCEYEQQVRYRLIPFIW
ncbi:MAG: isoprenylcysteine carboxylmethyltransferase family protein [Bacteroidales bacterium]|nr:isoprenylcysteine carboxylmethyltransferase family protein [Bacteroidales bacterium]